METKNEGAARDRPSAVKRYIPLAVLAVVFIAVYWSGIHRWLSLSAIAEHRDILQSYVNHHFVLALIIYMAVYIVCVALSLPGALLLTVLGGFLFGWFAGCFSTVVSATLGASVLFLIARSSLGGFLAEKAGPRIKALSEGLREDAPNYLLFLRLVPVFPFWLVNIAPALFGVSLPVFFVTTLIGIMPGTLAFSVVGSGLDSIIVEQQQIYDACVQQSGTKNCTFSIKPSALVTPEILAAFAALGAVALIPVAVRKLRARGQKS